MKKTSKNVIKLLPTSQQKVIIAWDCINAIKNSNLGIRGWAFFRGWAREVFLREVSRKGKQKIQNANEVWGKSDNFVCKIPSRCFFVKISLEKTNWAIKITRKISFCCHQTFCLIWFLIFQVQNYFSREICQFLSPMSSFGSIECVCKGGLNKDLW